MAWFLSYVGTAALWAVIALVAILAVARFVGRPLSRGTRSTLALTLFFLILTQHPFPDPGSLICPVPRTDPNLRPFAFVGRTVDLWRGVAPGTLWSVGPFSTVANLLLCMLIGGALSRRAGTLQGAVIFGAVLTLIAELSQLTGLWGLYPCAYRQFDVDDLILNVAGVVIGFLIGRAMAQPASAG